MTIFNRDFYIKQDRQDLEKAEGFLCSARRNIIRGFKKGKLEEVVNRAVGDTSFAIDLMDGKGNR